LPTAVGGSSIAQWINDAYHRNVKLYSNFKDKITLGQEYGIIKGSYGTRAKTMRLQVKQLRFTKNSSKYSLIYSEKTPMT